MAAGPYAIHICGVGGLQHEDKIILSSSSDCKLQFFLEILSPGVVSSHGAFREMQVRRKLRAVAKEIQSLLDSPVMLTMSSRQPFFDSDDKTGLMAQSTKR